VASLAAVSQKINFHFLRFHFLRVINTTGHGSAVHFASQNNVRFRRCFHVLADEEARPWRCCRPRSAGDRLAILRVMHERVEAVFRGDDGGEMRSFCCRGASMISSRSRQDIARAAWI